MVSGVPCRVGSTHVGLPGQPGPEVGLPCVPPGSQGQPVNAIRCGPATPALGTEIAHFLPFIWTCWGGICQNNLTAVPSWGQGQRRAPGTQGGRWESGREACGLRQRGAWGCWARPSAPARARESCRPDRELLRRGAGPRRAREPQLTEQIANSGLSPGGAGKAPGEMSPSAGAQGPSLPLLPGRTFGAEPGL